MKANTSNKLKEHALLYNKRGFSVIPVTPHGKNPIIDEWQKYCTVRSTPEEIERWWRKTPNANIGIACGPANGRFLFVVDQDVLKDENKNPILDDDGNFKERGDIRGCPPTVSQTTGSGGKQLFYYAPKGYEVRNRIGHRYLVDIRGIGGQFVIAPSIHKNGKEYQLDWEDLDPENITEFPKEDLDAFLGVNDNTKDSMDVVLSGVPVGQGRRHIGIAQVAGYYLRKAKTSAEIDMARVAVYAWDKMVNKSPEPEIERKKEIDNVFDGILKLEINKREGGETAFGNTSVMPRLWSIGEILSTDFGAEEWFVEFLVSKQGMTALSGNPGDFKTWVTIHIALCVARGLAVFGKFNVTQGAVLIIDEEDHIRLLKKRLELLGAKETDNIYYLSQSGIKVDTEEARNMLVDLVKEKDIKLVILDSLVRVHGQEENDAKGMAKVFSSLQKVIIAGASILFTHHHRKQVGYGNSNLGQSMRGSSDILAAVDCHITIEKKKDEENRLIIRQTKLRQAELLLPFEISILKGEFGPSGFEYVGDFDERRMKAEEVSSVVVSLLSDGMKNRGAIHEILKDEFGKTAIDEGIKIAVDNGFIEKVPNEDIPKQDRKKAHYRVLVRSSDFVESDLPASCTYIDTGKQEDEDNLFAELSNGREDLQVDVDNELTSMDN